MAKECKECNKDLSRYSHHYTEHGMCPDCLADSKGLVKVDNHYVPWKYRNHTDTLLPTDPDYFDDVYAKLPKVEWCDKHKKYKIIFDGPDFGGYDVYRFEWYYDTKEDIIKAMFGEV